MTDLNFDLKKALRQSAEAKHDRVRFIFFLTALLIVEAIWIAEIVPDQRALRAAKTELAQLESSGGATLRVEREIDDLNAGIGINALFAVAFGLGLGIAASYHGLYLLNTVSKPEAYNVYEARLVNPTPVISRGMVSLTAVYTDEAGQKVRRETRGIFQCSTMCWYNDMTEYNNQQVLVAYDPTGERLAVLRTSEELNKSQSGMERQA